MGGLALEYRLSDMRPGVPNDSSASVATGRRLVVEVAVNGIGSDRVREPRFVTGLVLVVLAAVLMLATEASIAAPITVLVVGVVLIARSRREGQNR